MFGGGKYSTFITGSSGVIEFYARGIIYVVAARGGNLSRSKKTVDYNQPGYAGDAMSVGAVQAYREGAMPISRWTKATIVDRVVELGGSELCGLYTLQQLKDYFLVHHSWHHTGVYANKTDFYCVDEAKARLCKSESMLNQYGEERVNRFIERLQTAKLKEPGGSKPRLKDTWVSFAELPEHRVEFVRISKNGNRIIRVRFINNRGAECVIEDVDHHLWGERFRIPFEECSKSTKCPPS